METAGAQAPQEITTPIQVDGHELNKLFGDKLVEEPTVLPEEVTILAKATETFIERKVNLVAQAMRRRSHSADGRFQPAPSESPIIPGLSGDMEPASSEVALINAQDQWTRLTQRSGNIGRVALN